MSRDLPRDEVIEMWFLAHDVDEDEKLSRNEFDNALLEICEDLFATQNNSQPTGVQKTQIPHPNTTVATFKPTPQIKQTTDHTTVKTTIGSSATNPHQTTANKTVPQAKVTTHPIQTTAITTKIVPHVKQVITNTHQPQSTTITTTTTTKLPQAKIVTTNATGHDHINTTTKVVPHVNKISAVNTTQPLTCVPSTTTQQGFPSQDKIKEDCLAAHNKLRAAVGVPPLKWSDDLAKSAHTVANNCLSKNALVHSTRGGENLWAGSSKDVQAMVNKWGGEIEHFNSSGSRKFPDIAKFGKSWATCGHYSQCVWRETTHVGGALVESNGRLFFCCHYEPKGNVSGKQVY